MYYEEQQDNFFIKNEDHYSHRENSNVKISIVSDKIYHEDEKILHIKDNNNKILCSIEYKNGRLQIRYNNKREYTESLSLSSEELHKYLFTKSRKEIYSNLAQKKRQEENENTLNKYNSNNQQTESRKYEEDSPNNIEQKNHEEKHYDSNTSNNGNQEYSNKIDYTQFFHQWNLDHSQNSTEQLSNQSHSNSNQQYPNNYEQYYNHNYGQYGSNNYNYGPFSNQYQEYGNSNFTAHYSKNNKPQKKRRR